jgi:anti-anti-sigma regulatory factor
MQFKIDTKERFQVVTVQESFLSATMAEQLSHQLTPYLQYVGTNDHDHPNPPANIVLVLSEVADLENKAAETLVELQQEFYDHNASFVICHLQPSIENRLDELGLLEVMNVTPTESEAWDIVQMEEIERELLGDEPDNS